MNAPSSTLLIRAHDAGSTFMSFRWLDQPSDPVVHRVDAPAMGALNAELAGMLPSDGTTALRAATGPFTRADTELDFARRAAELLLPFPVRRRINAAEEPLDIRMTPSRALARMPFELLAVDGYTRLIEKGTVVVEPPATVHIGRSRVPWTGVDPTRLPVVYIVDPRVPATERMGSVLDHRPGMDADVLLVRRISDRARTKHSGVNRIVTRWDLSDDLRQPVARLLYMGHVSSTLDQPGSASLHLSDRGTDFGMAQSGSGGHRPFSALDLLFGTAVPELGPDDVEPIEPGVSGPELWPMPPRVAVIACEGGVDYRSSETFGLVMALFNAGAELVTTSRWVLPTDTAFRRATGGSTVPGPTTALAIAVDAAHDAEDPVAALTAWQRDRLAAWRTDPGPLTSPLSWAAVTSHVCPARAVLPPVPQEDSHRA